MSSQLSRTATQLADPGDYLQAGTLRHRL